MEGVAVADGFHPCAGASVSTLTTFPPPSDRTLRADFPYWACMLVSVTKPLESGPDPQELAQSEASREEFCSLICEHMGRFFQNPMSL